MSLFAIFLSLEKCLQVLCRFLMELFFWYWFAEFFIHFGFSAILDIANVFSHSVYRFGLLMSSFAVWKLLNLIMSFPYVLFYFYFLSNQFLKNLFVYFLGSSAGSLLLCRLFFSCGKWRLLSSCSSHVSLCSGFSWHSGSVAPQHVGSSQSKDWTRVFPIELSGKPLPHWQVSSLPLSHQENPVPLLILGVILFQLADVAW